MHLTLLIAWDKIQSDSQVGRETEAGIVRENNLVSLTTCVVSGWQFAVLAL